MRRFLFTVVGLFLSASMGMALSLGDDLMEQLFEEAGVSPAPSSEAKDLETLSSGGEEAFQNLYLHVYQTVKEEPQKAAIEKLSEDSEYSKNELEAILLEGDLSPLKEDFDTQEEVAEAYLELSESYQEVLAIYRDNHALAYEALAKEMFMDDDLSNSGRVDLVYDLRLIYYVLFGEDLVLPDRETEDTVILSSEESFSNPLELVGPPLDLGAEEEATVVLAADSIYCGPDADLTEALELFEAESYMEDYEEEMEDEEEGAIFGSLPDFDSPETYLGGLGSEALSDLSSKDSLEEFLATIQGHPGDWVRELPCTDLFCVHMNFVTETYSTSSAETRFEPTQNCINCHLTYILQALEETTSGSLIANKVPMNFMEDGTCKEAGLLSQLDMNIFFISKPIVLEPGDQTEDIPTVNADEFEEGLMLHLGLPGLHSVSSEEVDIDTQRITYFYPNTDQGEVLAEIEQAGLIQEQKIAELYEAFLLETDAESNLILYEQAAAEITSLKLYFEGFNEALLNSYSLGEAPLSSLINKPYCQ